MVLSGTMSRSTAGRINAVRVRRARLFGHFAGIISNLAMGFWYV